MPDTLFHQFADNEGWCEATQVGLLLRYIGAQDDLATFADFLAQCRDSEPGGATDPADRFMWEVAENLGNPGLTLNAAFQSFAPTPQTCSPRARPPNAGAAGRPHNARPHDDRHHGRAAAPG
jgi:hypothetical protein